MDIDIVILWVDGNDQAWLKEKAKYQTEKTTDANAVNRFRDWGLMKYWFRSIEAFAPWVRIIHFVTWGHVPEFLDLKHSKLHIVRHEDYLPQECLPLFNACAIEMSIHKIQGLAEHFIFFNDDMFLLRPLTPEHFFHRGLPRVNGSETVTAPIIPLRTWHAIFYNDLGIINKHFSKKTAVVKNRSKYINRAYDLKSNIKTFAMELLYKNQFVGFKYSHAAASFCKQSFEELWAAEPMLLQETTKHRFREDRDVNQWAVLWWQIASGNFYPGRIDNALFTVHPWMVPEICSTIREQSHDMICINDPDDPTDFEKASRQIQESFELILPNKCSFEK